MPTQKPAAQRPKVKPLTRKQKNFADILLNNPKMSGTQAALRAYGKPDEPTTYGTASQIALDNLRNPNVQVYLNKHEDKAVNRIVNLVDSAKEEIALRASQDILDRNRGKATQQIETRSHQVTINIDLSPDGGAS